MARKPFTFENNYDKVIAKIEDTPEKVMNILGQNLTKEIRANIRASGSSRRGMLAHALGYWARKKEKDLQIGFKMSIGATGKPSYPGIVGHMMTQQEPDPIKPVVIKNKDLIVQTIAKALDEITKRGK
jgi:hypothetical protein